MTLMNSKTLCPDILYISNLLMKIEEKNLPCYPILMAEKEVVGIYFNIIF